MSTDTHHLPTSRGSLGFHRPWSRLKAIIGITVLLAALLAVAPPAAAATFEVDRLDDPAGAGACGAGLNDCSLRQAVLAANAAAGADVVMLPAGTIVLNLTGTGEGAAASGDLDILDDLELIGQAGSAIDASALGDRVFDVVGAAALVLSDVVVSGGAAARTAPADPSVEGSGGAVRLTAVGASLDAIGVTLSGHTAETDGGAIAMAGPGQSVVLEQSEVLDNTAGSGGAGDGGGIDARSDGGSVTILETRFERNEAIPGGGIGGDGGGIHVQAAGMVLDISAVSAFTDNVADDDGGAIAVEQTTDLDLDVNAATFTGNSVGDEGGAIKVFLGAGSDVDITDTTFEANSGLDGGAVHIVGSGTGTVTVEASTFDRNIATRFGGGITLESSTATLDVTNATFSGNDAATGSAMRLTGPATLTHVTVGGHGGPSSIQVEPPGALTLESSILADAATANCAGAGAITDAGGNVDDDGSCLPVATANPGLGALALNAPGTTATMAIGPGSVAVNRGVPAHCPPADQRGVARPIGAACDSGAYETALGGGGGGGPTPTPQRDLVAGITAVPDEIEAGADSVVTSTVRNTAGSALATGVTMEVTIPTGLDVTDVDTVDGTCTIAAPGVTCTIEDLSGGEQAVVEIGVEGVDDGAFTVENTVDLTQTDAVPGNNTATDLIEVTDAAVPPTVIEGPTRVETGVAGSEEIFDPGEADSVIIARSDIEPDSQAGTPLAEFTNGPILVTPPDALHPAVAQEITRVLAPDGTIYILGGTQAISLEVQAQIEALGFEVMRLGGVNRFDTARIIAQTGLPSRATTLVADGADFLTSIPAGAAAAAAGGVVVLVDGDRMPQETADYLSATPDAEVIAIGEAATGLLPEAESINGSDEFALSVAIAQRFFTDPPAIGVATNATFVDALTGSSVVAILGGPMLFTAPDDLPEVVGDYVGDNAAALEHLLVFGGPAAVAQSVVDELADAVGAL